MPDSGDAAMAGAVIGGILAYSATNGNVLGATIGAGAGLVVSGHSTEDILGELED